MKWKFSIIYVNYYPMDEDKKAKINPGLSCPKQNSKSTILHHRYWRRKL
jgi:hypothetical protein